MFRARHWLPLFTLLVAISCKPAPDSGPKPAVGKGALPKGPAIKPGPKVAQKAADVPTFERPKAVRGIYLTAWSASSGTKLAKMVALLDRTELNSVVIDVRDTGEVYFPVDDPMVKRVHEVQHGTLTAFPKPARAAQLMQRLSKAGVYPIARVACFRDNFVPKLDASRAVQIPGGQPWHDRSNHYWLDPYDRRNWEYLAKIVDYAMDLGFPEIQLDYVRFPSEGKSSTQVFPNKAKYGDPKAHPDDVITAFADWMGKRVRARGCAYSADVFGIISESKKDQGIGQTLEKIAAPFDTLSPMVYPSHFAHGEYGIPNPNAAPYETIHKSLSDYKRRIPKKAIRPWLQDFSLGAPHYGVKEVQAQIKAAHDLGYEGFLMWNAGNRYTEGAYGKPDAVESKHGETPSPKPAVVPAGRA